MIHDATRTGLRHLVLGAMRPAKAKNVTVGDRFEESEADLPVWIVDRISHVRGSLFPLVSLRREGNPDLERTLSISALDDQEVYRRATLKT